MRTVYFTESGSLESFFTAVFDGYKDETAYLTSSAFFQPSLGDTVLCVRTNEEKAERVARKIRSLDERALYEIERILRSNKEDREQIAFEYIRVLVQEKRPVRGMLLKAEIRRAIDELNKVTKEVHHMKGFLRFQETQDGVFYAPFSPDHDIVDLLVPHFSARFSGTPFILHDVKRKKAAVSDGKNYGVFAAEHADVLISEQEDALLRLWKSYYKNVSIAARKNTRQMKNYMPVRYWRFMPEKEDE